MTDVDQFEFQTKYVRYLSTQQRVSDWVRGPGSQNRSRTRIGRKPSGPRHITKSSPAPSPSFGSSTKETELAVSTTVACQQQTALLDSESQIISPTVALISSALLICIILPSLFTVSAFVVLLTYAGSPEDDVSLTNSHIIYRHFYSCLQESRNQITSDHCASISQSSL